MCAQFVLGDDSYAAAKPENVVTIEEIKIALKNKIKPDNPKVVAGKIAALQVKNNNYADLAKQTEELADVLERSLVIEGITKVKAHEMAIEQTVSVGRLNAKSDLVKSILASTAFTDPKDRNKRIKRKIKNTRNYY